MPTSSPAATAAPQAADSPAPFTHTPRPPITCERYESQRHYGVDDCDAINGLRGAGEQWSSATVFRNAPDLVARLEVEVGCGHNSNASVSLQLDPQGLRNLAARLIDAAHDIEFSAAQPLRRAA